MRKRQLFDIDCRRGRAVTALLEPRGGEMGYQRSEVSENRMMGGYQIHLHGPVLSTKAQSEDMIPRLGSFRFRVCQARLDQLLGSRM